MHNHWDVGMCAHLGNMTRAGMGPQKFVEANQDLISLVLDSDDVKKVAKAGSNVRQVSDELRKLVSSSQLGARIYGSMLSSLAEKSFWPPSMRSSKMNLETATSPRVLSRRPWRARRAAQKWEVDERCPQRRELEVWYRELKLLVVVGHSNEMIAAKTRAVARALECSQESSSHCGL